MDKKDYKSYEEQGHLAKGVVYPRLDLSEGTRYLYFSKIFEKIKEVEGDIIECGVGWGRSLLYLSILTRIENKGRKIWGFDSFEGFPEPTEEDISYRNPKKGEWKADILSVYKLLDESGLDKIFTRYQITIIKGYFEESLKQYKGNKIALLHADADIYNSYKSIYENLYEKVVPCGIILFDEYMNTFENEKWPGAKKAIDEFFLKDAELKRDSLSGKYYAIKK